jgi:hypothetical protein
MPVSRNPDAHRITRAAAATPHARRTA